ncbi:MAG: Rieske (2Fe-2S) protein [Candidatus Altiarchaeota archaeon]
MNDFRYLFWIFTIAFIFTAGCLGGTQPETQITPQTTATQGATEPPKTGEGAKTTQPTMPGEQSTSIPLPAGGPSGGAPSPEAQFIATTEEVPPGFTFEFELGGEQAILINFAGEFRAYFNKCDHKGGPTLLEGDTIVCQWHGSQFEPLSGGLKKGPATGPLRIIPLEIREGGIYVP